MSAHLSYIDCASYLFFVSWSTEKKNTKKWVDRGQKSLNGEGHPDNLPNNVLERVGYERGKEVGAIILLSKTESDGNRTHMVKH